MYSSRLWLSVVIYILSHRHVIAEFSPTISSLEDGLQSEDGSMVLESINARDYRINITKNQNGKPWHDERYNTYCLRPAKCERLQNSTCFGSKIPYKFTSLALTDATSQDDSRGQMRVLEAIRNVPECWKVIQVSQLNNTYYLCEACISNACFSKLLYILLYANFNRRTETHTRTSVTKCHIIDKLEC